MSSKIKIDKAELKGPDVFVGTSDKIFNYVEKHFKTFAGICLVLLVGAISYVTYGYLNAAKEQRAAEALYGPEGELRKIEASQHDERTKMLKDLATAKAGKNAPPAKVADFEKDFAPAVEKIKSAVKAHADTKAALVSALHLSYFLTQKKHFPEALAILEIPTYHPADSELLGGFWLMHRGVVLLENNQIEPAIKSYQTVLASTNLKPFHAEALLKLGICFELKGDAAQARESYEKVGRDFPETEASSSARQYLRLLDLNSHKKG